MAISYCIPTINEDGLEMIQHGTTRFPIASYHDNLTTDSVPWHWHEEFEVILVEEGEVIVSSGTKKYTVPKGDGVFTNAGVLHADQNAGTGFCRLHSLVFHPTLIGGNFDSIFWHDYLHPLIKDTSMDGFYLSQNIPWQKEALDHIENAWQKMKDEPAGYEFEIRESLSRLIFLLTTHALATKATPSAKFLRDGERIKIMLQYIQQHFSEKIQISDIANSVMISESECLRCFHNTIHTTPIQYLKEFRITQAAQLLLTTDEQISEIGTQCGFQEMSYFSKTFRKFYGCTPGEYRETQSCNSNHNSQ